MSSYKIDFLRLRSSPGYVDIFKALERGLLRFHVDFYLLGAWARDLWFRGVGDIEPQRATRDIDIGICINSPQHFMRLKEYFVSVEGFTEYKENPYVIIWKDRTEIDLIPFGAIAEEGFVRIGGVEMSTLGVDGMIDVSTVRLLVTVVQ